MSYKWFGAILVIAGCGGFGFLMAKNYKRELNYLTHLIIALDYMGCELEYRCTPLPDLCRKTADLQRGLVKNVLITLAQEMENQVAPDVKCCMNSVLEKLPDIPKRVKNALELLGTTLGQFDLTGQVRGLEATREVCRKALEELEHNRTQRIRGYQTLGLCAGAALAILFI